MVDFMNTQMGRYQGETPAEKFYALPGVDLVVAATNEKGFDEESLRMAYDAYLGDYFLSYTLYLKVYGSSVVN